MKPLTLMVAFMLAGAMGLGCGSSNGDGSGDAAPGPGGEDASGDAAEALDCAEAGLAWATAVDEAVMEASACSIGADCVLREPVLECDQDVLIGHPHVAVSAELATEFDAQMDATRAHLCERVENCQSSTHGFTSPVAVCDDGRCSVVEE